MNLNYCHIAIVLDRSGSMASCKKDTIGGFNEFLDKQKSFPGEATISLYQFDTKYDVVYENKNIKEAPQLNEHTFIPRGSTALYDAIGKTIVSTGELLRAMPEEKRPGKVFFVIITDGEENASTEYQYDRIKEMIGHQESKYSWEFVFIGSELGAVSTAIDLGIKKGNTLCYAANSVGTNSMYSSLNKNMRMYRSAVARGDDLADMEFFEESDRTIQNNAK